MTPEQRIDRAGILYRARRGLPPTAHEVVAMLDRIEQLEAALLPFTLVVLGEHRQDHDNVWHSLKVYNFRDARKVYRGESII